ncbi:hypothetical protein, partial [Burkholderia cepacia]|uniref:hypothetical protein n=1 Tax=Burkholderia cepacia TaxID=292 RepID=UPI002ABD2576
MRIDFEINAAANLHLRELGVGIHNCLANPCTNCHEFVARNYFLVSHSHADVTGCYLPQPASGVYLPSKHNNQDDYGKMRAKQ